MPPLDLSAILVEDHDEHPFADQLRAMHVLGANRVEITMLETLYADAYWDQVRRDIEAAGLAVWSMHGQFGEPYDLSSPDPRTRRRGIESLRRDIEALARLGGTHLITHPSTGPIPPPDRPDRIRLAADSIHKLAEHAAAAGVKLALENMTTSVPTVPDEMSQLLALLPEPNVCVVFDSGHANLHNATLSLLRAVAGRLETLHLHDNAGTEDNHWLPYAPGGTVDWAGLIQILKEINYTGPFLIEVPISQLARDTIDDAHWLTRIKDLLTV